MGLFWTPDNLARITQGRWLTPPMEAMAHLDGLGTDTRSLRRGQVFLALRGENHDAHDLLQAAVDAGAAMLIVDDQKRATAVLVKGVGGVGTLLVTDTLVALQTLAMAYRDHLRALKTTVIAVVGSNGKTTTRHLIHTVLSATLQGSQSPKSFNNHIGVPLTLLAAGDGLRPAGSGGAEPGATSGRDAFVVVEVGTNHPGEITALGAIVRPDIVVMTSIGHEHMEFFGSLQGVAREEASILRHLAPDGLAVVPGDPETMEHLAPALADEPLVRQRLVLFGTDASCEAKLLNVEERGCTQRCIVTLPRFDDAKPTAESLEFTLPMPGRHNAGNALAALVVGRWMGLADNSMTTALQTATGVPMRMAVTPLLGGGTLLNDAYNANPDSVIAALRTLTAMPVGVRADGTPARRIAVLGDMRELGTQAPDLHRLVGRTLGTLTPPDSRQDQTSPAIDLAILIGELSLYTAEALMRHWPPQRVRTVVPGDENLWATVAAMIQPGDVVLIKASRACALERLIPALEHRLSLASLPLPPAARPVTSSTPLPAAL